MRWGRVGGARKRSASTNVLWGLGRRARRLAGMCPCLEKMAGSPYSEPRNLESWERAGKSVGREGLECKKTKTKTKLG